MFGLPVHLWGKEFFKIVGDACRGFVMVDVETEERHHLKWDRLLVKSSGRKVPTQLVVVDREDVFAIHLWWEVSPWLSTVVFMESCRSPEVRDKREGSSGAVGRVEEKGGRHVAEGLQAVAFEQQALGAKPCLLAKQWQSVLDQNWSTAWIGSLLGSLVGL